MAQHLSSLTTTSPTFPLTKAIARRRSAFQGRDVKRIARQDLIQLSQRSFQDVCLQECLCFDIQKIIGVDIVFSEVFQYEILVVYGKNRTR